MQTPLAEIFQLCLTGPQLSELLSGPHTRVRTASSAVPPPAPPPSEGVPLRAAALPHMPVGPLRARPILMLKNRNHL